MEVIKKQSKSKIKGHFRYTVYEPGTSIVKEQSDWMPNNIVVNDGNGLNIPIKMFLGVLSGNNLEATAAKIGTDSTAPSDADTNLIAPEQNADSTDFAVPRSTQNEDSDTQATVNFFFADIDLTNSTVYKEFGVFVGGSTPDVTHLTGGKLWARMLISPTYTHNGGDVKFSYQINIAEQ